jgi:hypothetical protein
MSLNKVGQNHRWNELSRREIIAVDAGRSKSTGDA